MTREGALSPAEWAGLLSRYRDPGPVTGLVLAVSGGPDSVALMGGMALLRPTVPVHVGTVDHGLRPEAAGEAAAVRRAAAALGLPCTVLAWTGPKPRAGLPAASRAARYRLLADLARGLGASHVLTAHHRDDQAETVLMRLAAGSGPDGLAAMRAESPLGDLVLARPLLGVPKARLVATCLEREWPFVEDPSNLDETFARARLRRIRDLLAGEGLTDARLSLLARRAQRTEAALSRTADEACASLRTIRPNGTVVLDGAGLLAAPEAIALRVVAGALAEVPGCRDRVLRLERLETLVLDGLLPALAHGRPFRRTLAGALITVAACGAVALRPEPPRRSLTPSAGARVADAAAAPHLLGNVTTAP